LQQTAASDAAVSKRLAVAEVPGFPTRGDARENEKAGQVEQPGASGEILFGPSDT
jgi:hypothetical protein